MGAREDFGDDKIVLNIGFVVVTQVCMFLKNLVFRVVAFYCVFQ